MIVVRDKKPSVFTGAETRGRSNANQVGFREAVRKHVLESLHGSDDNLARNGGSGAVYVLGGVGGSRL